MLHRLTIATALLTLAACGGGADSGGALDGSPTGSRTPTSADQVAVTLDEFSVAADPASAPEGQIEFTATNAGTIDHELVIIMTDLPPDELPTKGATVDENAEGLEVRGEIPPFAKGTSEDGIFALDAGKHVLICNVAGHYQAGMRVGFVVLA